MNINELLKGMDCACGKHHHCDIDYVYIEKDAISRLSELCKSYNKILLVADENTFSAAGEKTVSALRGKTVEQVIFSGKEVLVPDETAIETVHRKLSGAEVIVGVGSGVIQDLCKYVSFENKIPYMIVATAPSMDGYASDGAAMILGGMKVTCKAGLPRAIIADTDILANAPMDMIKAGYGDIIGKFSALNDWKLSRCVNGEYFCEYIYDLTYEQLQKTLKLAHGLLQRNGQSIQTLMEALVVVGILMSFAGSSRPASGSEHHLSHFFEITGILDKTDYFSHGIDVAYSTVITAALREKILQKEFPRKVFRLSREEYAERMEKIYKQSAAGCMALQERVGNYTRQRLPVYLEKEEQIRQILAQMPSAGEIKDMLRMADLPMEDFYALYGEEKIQNAILYSKDLKDRYSVLWLYYDLFAEDPINIYEV